MQRIRDKMIEDMKLRGYSEASTIRQYPGHVERFIRYHGGRPPGRLGEQEVREFMLHLVEVRKIKPATQCMYLAALCFLYKVTLRRPEVMAYIPWPKVDEPLPDILSGHEVDDLLAAIRSIKQRALLMLCYGAGLRISEACRLEIGDVDSQRKLIRVRKGKRNKDRYVVLGDRLLETLREYFRRFRPSGPYLFPGRQREGHLGVEAVRKYLRVVVTDAGITKRVTPHLLRHAFATHLLEAGTNERCIQALLGHKSLDMVTRYTRVSRMLGRTRSPLDLLGTKEGEILG